jgi:hypothetical protein
MAGQVIRGGGAEQSRSSERIYAGPLTDVTPTAAGGYQPKPPIHLYSVFVKLVIFGISDVM